MIREIPDVLGAAELARCRAALEGSAWRDGRETAGHMAVEAKRNQQLAPDDPVAIELGELILKRLARVDRFVAAALPLKVLPPRFNRYVGGGAYGDHIDNAVFSVPGTPHRVRGDLSATLFLSDPSEYDGGVLTIRSGAGTRAVRLPAGHMVLYPAGSVHCVTPVTRGVRLAAFFWIQSLVRDHGEREMLLELDEAIQALGRIRGAEATRLRLTGLYHNLLRHWADT